MSANGMDRLLPPRRGPGALTAAHLTDAAVTDEKRAIGALWEWTSAGKGLFLVVEKQVDGKDMRGQMATKVRLNI